MHADRLFLRASMVVHETSDVAPLHFQRNGDRLIILRDRTGITLVRRGARLGSLIAALVGLAAIPTTVLGILIACAGAIGFALATHEPRPKPLLEINAAGGDVSVAAAGGKVQVSEISSLHGVRADGQCAVCAVLKDGSEVVLLTFAEIARMPVEFVSRTLGYLLEVPSDYVEPLGAVKSCYVLNPKAALTRLGDLSASGPERSQRPRRQRAEERLTAKSSVRERL